MNESHNWLTTKQRRSYQDLTTPPPQGPGSWTEEGIRTLVKFTLFYEREHKWPCHKRSAFRKGAGTYIQIRCKTLHLCSGAKHYFTDDVFASIPEATCRYKVVAWLKPKFPIPVDANVHYFGHGVQSVILSS